jgi:hypothetical protein
MPTTTNNGWPTPADTDLVKNGADAIRDLGNAIDTTLGVYSPVTPMGVKLTTVTFSAVASQAINNVFTSTYKNYKVVTNITQTTGASGQIIGTRMRVGGVSASAADYNFNRFGYSFPGVLNVDAGSGSTYFFINRSNGSGSIDGESVAEITFYAPQLAERTFVTALSVDGLYAGVSNGYHNLATAYDGFEMFTTTGATTMTGSVSVYGFNV